MRAANVFQLELSRAAARPRAALMRVALAVLLGLPFVLVRMPPRVQSAGVATVVVFTAFFGAAVAHARRRVDGHLRRLRLLPLPRWLVFADLCLSSSASRLVPTACVTGLYLAVNARRLAAPDAVACAGHLTAAVVLLTAAALALASAVRNNAEVHLLAALCVGLIAAASGLVPAPAAIAGAVERIAAWSPSAHLARALEHSAGRGAGVSPAAAWADACLGAVLLAGMVLRGLGVPAPGWSARRRRRPSAPRRTPRP